jgi:hypothetical protein
MPRSSFGLASLWGSLTVLSLCGTASAQWFPGTGGSSCGCSAPTLMGSPPIMRQSASAYGAAPMMSASYAYGDSVQCGAPVACHIEQPVQMQVVHVQQAAPVVQTVAVQQLRPVIQPVMEDVRVTEFQPVRQTVSKPVMKTVYVDQMVTEMRPVSEQKTVNVATVDYQTVTEYKTVQKQVGYWVTKNVPTGRVNSWQYDNRQNAAGFMNRASYDMRNAFTPTHNQVRQFCPQTMTCTVPCSKKVAVPGMKQVTYNITRMEPTQTTRKVAVNQMSYETAEVTVMRPVQVVRTMQTGTRVSYAPVGSTTIGSVPPAAGGTAIGLQPTADPSASAKRPTPPRTAEQEQNMNPDNININNKRGASLQPSDPLGQQMSASTFTATSTATETSASAKKFSAPSIVRVSQWVARTPASSAPLPGGKSAAISIADSTR